MKVKILFLLFLLLVACESPKQAPNKDCEKRIQQEYMFLGESYKHPICTPDGILVYRWSEYEIDLDYVDEVYGESALCASVDSEKYLESFTVVIINDCDRLRNIKNGRTLGMYQRSTKTVALSTSLNSLGHELGHHFSCELERYTSDKKPDSGSLGLLESDCGDPIDKEFWGFDFDYPEVCEHLLIELK